MRRSSNKATYKEWLALAMQVINEKATPIRPLRARDFPTVNFEALWRQSHDPQSAAHVAQLITAYSVPA